jgi:flagellar biosynthetic protein FliR
MDLTTQVGILLLIAARAGAVVFSAPVFGSRNVPRILKAATSFIIAVTLFRVIKLPQALPEDTFTYALLVFKESFVGLMIGFATSMLMNGLFIAGQVVDTQMGLGLANVVDPVSEVQIPLIGQFNFLIATLIFLAIGGPYYLIKSLQWSYQTIPLGDLSFPYSFGRGLLFLSAKMWAIGLQIGVPAIGTLLLTMLALGIVAKTVPQMNVFIVGFPITITTGLIAVYVSLFTFRPVIERVFRWFFETVHLLLSAV